MRAVAACDEEQVVARRGAQDGPQGVASTLHAAAVDVDARVARLERPLALRDVVVDAAPHGVRLLRDNVVIHEGTLKTLKRFKDEVPEVQSGQECGMAFENYDDIREGDVIEIFEREEVERSLV